MILTNSIFSQKSFRFLIKTYVRSLTFILFTHFFSTNLSSQSQTDSLLELRNDSVAKIPLIVKSFQADQANLQIVVDSNSSFLHTDTDFGRSLNNFNSPQFRLSNVNYSMRIYENGINSMNFRMTGFDNYTFLFPNKPIAEIATHRGKAFANSQAGFQDNFDIHLVFAENFRNRVLWNFSYDRNDYLGIYTNGLQESSLFTTGVQYTGQKDKFHINILYLDERHTIQDNWGIRTDSVFSDPNYSIRESVPVKVTIASTNITERSIGLNFDFPYLINRNYGNPFFS